MNRSARDQSGTTASMYGAEDEEIEYNITFPSCASSDDVKEPVVYLLGWMGATDRHLAKYSKIYEEMGCITIRYIYIPSNSEVSKKSELSTVEKYSEKLAQLLEDYDLNSNPVMFHSFSNGGALLYSGLVKNLIDKQCSIIGSIFDSGPSRNQYTVLLQALYHSIKSNILMYILLASATVIQTLWKSVQHYLGIMHYVESFKEISKWHFANWPHLFLYSSSDQVCPVQHVSEFIDMLKMNSNCMFVREYNFETSPHVLHLKYHKEIYEKQCIEFIEDCLAIYDGEDARAVTDEREKSKESSVDFPNQPNNEQAKFEIGHSSQTSEMTSKI